MQRRSLSALDRPAALASISLNNAARIMLDREPVKLRRCLTHVRSNMRALLKLSLEAMAALAFPLPFRQDLEQELGAAPVQFHVAELVNAEQVNAAVAGDGLDKLLVVGGFDQLVDELGGQGIADR